MSKYEFFGKKLQSWGTKIIPIKKSAEKNHEPTNKNNVQSEIFTSNTHA